MCIKQPRCPARAADKKTIKSAYRQLARKFHPDVNKEADAEERFKDISAAYEVRQQTQWLRRCVRCLGVLQEAYLHLICHRTWSCRCCRMMRSAAFTIGLASRA